MRQEVMLSINIVLNILKLISKNMDPRKVRPVAGDEEVTTAALA